MVKILGFELLRLSVEIKCGKEHNLCASKGLYGRMLAFMQQATGIF